ncbi:SDR family NAD(P)-dependent oxidoreductase [bacterium]|nr:SDR family NAD(P)-dependent oxidoreductase [bacterium]
MERALVTGGAGFIGSHLVDALAQAGMKVLVIDTLQTGTEKNLATALATGNVELVKADIRSDEAFQAILNFKPAAVFHHAAQASVRLSVENPAYDVSVNVEGTVRLLEAAKQAAVRNFIFASTGGAIYGEQEIFPASESHPSRAECPYGVSKRAGELFLEYYTRQSNIQATALRYANVYGPRQNAKGEAGVVAIFCGKLLEQKQLIVNGDGEQTRDFVYVADVVKANLLALHRQTGEKFAVFNVGTGIETSVNQITASLVKAFSDIFSTQPKSEILHGPAMLGEQRRSVIDHSRIKSQLGWSQTVTLDRGLLETLRSFHNVCF